MVEDNSQIFLVNTVKLFRILAITFLEKYGEAGQYGEVVSDLAITFLEIYGEAV